MQIAPESYILNALFQRLYDPKGLAKSLSIRIRSKKINSDETMELPFEIEDHERGVRYIGTAHINVSDVKVIYLDEN